MNKCIGCGSTLQSIDKDKEGYVFEDLLILDPDRIYCRRCYQIQKYGKVTRFPFDLAKYQEQLAIIKKEKALVVLIIDVLDLYGSYHKEIIKAIAKSEVIILINKVDVLPKTIKLANIEKRVKMMAEGSGLNVLKVLAISAIKDYNLNQVMNLIMKNKRQTSVYLVGLANTGKSTFLNTIIKKYYDEKKDVITTSYIQGTTYDLIKIPLDDKSFLIDTPGLISESQYATYLSDQSMKVISPKKFLKPIVYQLNPDQTIFVGGLFRLDILAGDKISVTTYLANTIYVHRTKLANAQTLYDNQVTKQLSPPTEEELTVLGPLKEKVEVTLEHEKTDIFIGGLGFIHLTGTNVKIRAYMPDKIDIKIVNSFF